MCPESGLLCIWARGSLEDLIFCRSRRTVQSSELDPPDPSTSAGAQPITTLSSQSTLWSPADIVDFVIASPARRRSLGLNITVCRGPIDTCTVARIQQVPHKNKRIIRTTSQHSSAAGVPLDRVERGRVTAQLEESGTGLARIENSDEVGIGGKGGEKMRVVRRRRKPQEWRCG